MRKVIALSNTFIKRIYYNKNARFANFFTKYLISNILKNKKKRQELKNSKSETTMLYC